MGSNGRSEVGSEREPAAPPIPARLGEILMRRGLVTSEELHRALTEQAGGAEWRLGRILVHQGAVDDADLTAAIADQFHVPVVNVRRQPPGPGAVAHLDREAAIHLQALPLEIGRDALVVAVSDPPTRELRVAIERSVGRPVRLVLCPADELAHALEYWYPIDPEPEPAHTAARPASPPPPPPPPAPGPAAAFPPPPTAGAVPRAPETTDTDRDVPPARLDDQVVEWLLAEASRQGAVAVHLDHDGTGLRVRYRVPEAGLAAGPRLPTAVGTVVCHRLLAAAADAGSGEGVHEGRFDAQVAGRAVTCCVVAFGSASGTHVVLRIGPRDRRSVRLEAVGLDHEGAAALAEVIHSGHGVVAVVGAEATARNLLARAIVDEAGPHRRSVAVVGCGDGLGIPLAAVIGGGPGGEGDAPAVRTAIRLGVDLLVADVTGDFPATLAAFDAAAERLVVLLRPERDTVAVAAGLVAEVGALLVAGTLRSVVVAGDDLARRSAAAHFVTDEVCRAILDLAD